MSLIFQTERLCGIREQLSPLLRRHWEEVAVHGVCGSLDINEDAYMRLELAGALHITTARTATRRNVGELVGYAAYILSRNLHYQSRLTAEADVFFLAPECRRGLAGLRLLRAAEAALAARGVNIIVQKVKTAHDCGALFRRMGYAHVENIYMKGV